MTSDEIEAVLEHLVSLLQMPFMAQFEQLSIVVKHKEDRAAVYLNCDDGKAEYCIYRPTEDCWAKADECSQILYKLLGTGPVQYGNNKLM